MTNVRRHKHSRSVGCQDDQDLSILASTTSIMGSESNIYNMKLNQDPNTSKNYLKTHSDSEISRMSENDSVIFTLGDSTIDIETEKLVKISINNDDEWNIDENVKRVCTEIEDFCTNNSELESVEKLNMDKAKVIEDTVFDVCESNKDGNCDIACSNVTEVIVIPSAEAILETDTGNKYNDCDVQ
ncbi:PREDICTED: uncharacterized protein LOC106108954 [Papilio polytes]|uniref:uncharacterized protein LOC106108954 n=1 Tax=Papilio polytes TaxID=76194 RepID=UPI0006760C03|nr:PREDICTED: uncharacterized protein LOC106108954 [Papilio polytes]